jgi:hypothetical protein
MLKVTVNSSIANVREEFCRLFPFLRLEFYTQVQRPQGPGTRKHTIADEALLRNLDLGSEAEFVITEQMPVSQLEHLFQEKFGVGAQVYRRFGNVWLETSVTSDWTLQRQNEHAREVSELR